MRCLLFLLLFYGSLTTTLAQPGSSVKNRQRSVEIPFEYYNNFILVKLTFNGALPLVFIFDTGAEYTVLSKPEVARAIGLKYERSFKIAGSDLSTLLTAYLCRGVGFDLTEKVNAYGQDILVLEEDYFKFDEHVGTTVHGILSAHIFEDYIMEINYQKGIIRLHQREYFKPGRTFPKSA